MEFQAQILLAPAVICVVAAYFANLSIVFVVFVVVFAVFTFADG